mgnify:CR=1 FL=1
MGAGLQLPVRRDGAGAAAGQVQREARRNQVKLGGQGLRNKKRAKRASGVETDFG